MKIYSERIKRLRKERGLSQDQLAKILGVSRSTVGMYETGKREPDCKSGSPHGLVGSNPTASATKTA